MLSFLIIVSIYLIPLCYNIVIDCLEGKTKDLWKMIIAVIVLMVAIYLKSIGK